MDMDKKEFYMVDVFSGQKFGGNQLAVFPQGHLFSDEEMQRITREINFSETTFIFPYESQGNRYRVRIFTPAAEVPFAGHPTLGTSFVIQRFLAEKPNDQIILDLNVGPIPVDLEYRDGEIDMMTMKQNPPVFGKTLQGEDLAKVLNLSVDDIDSRYPIQEVSTGLPFIMVPLKSMEAVQKARLAKDHYEKLIENLEAKAILFFAPQTVYSENQLHVRVFTEFFGVPEDPATGSANGCLAGYLLEYEYFGQEALKIQVEQGFEIGRDAILYLSGEKKDNQISVFVGGRAALFARGEHF
jgi:trans-2,3-dihydro-3-hydroxyanthranilate isomerase